MRLEAALVAVLDMRFNQRSKQVVRRANRMEIAGEVQIEVDGRRGLRLSSTGASTLHPEHGPKRRLSDADCSLRSEPTEPISEPYRSNRLAFTRRGRGDRSDDDQFAVLPSP